MERNFKNSYNKELYKNNDSYFDFIDNDLLINQLLKNLIIIQKQHFLININQIFKFLKIKILKKILSILFHFSKI